MARPATVIFSSGHFYVPRSRNCGISRRTATASITLSTDPWRNPGYRQEDVTNRWNQALNNWHREKLNSLAAGDEQAEEREQTQADTIALYLVSRAGYSPQALVNFFDRMAGTKGTTGGFWSDFFKTTTPDAKRLHRCLPARLDAAVVCCGSHRRSFRLRSMEEVGGRVHTGRR